MTKVHHHLNTIYPSEDAILYVGDIAVRMAAGALDLVQDVADFGDAWVSVSTNASLNGLYYVEHAVTVSDEPDDLPGGTSVRVDAWVTEQHLAVAIAGAILLAMDKFGFPTEFFRVEERPHNEVRLAIQSAVDERWVAPAADPGHCGHLLVQRVNELLNDIELERELAALT